jgi:hypothetical protein
MSDEFDHNPDGNYSNFWPVLILAVGLLIWFAVQDYGLNNQRSAYKKQFDDKQFQSTMIEAQNISTRYVALMKDLVQTAQKDPAAAQIVKDAIAANLIHVQPNATNSTTTPAAPTK